jgi:hypothetical protein
VGSDDAGQISPPSSPRGRARLRRLLKWTLVVVPTLLALLSLAAWVRSLTREDELRWGAVHVSDDGTWRHRQFRFASAGGRLILFIGDGRDTPPRLLVGDLVRGPQVGWNWSSEQIRPWPMKVSVPQRGRMVDIPGVEVSSSFDGMRSGDYSRSVHVGLSWSVSTFVMLVPAGVATAYAWRRARRRRKGVCSACGYDLRASRERCPECGAPIPPPPPINRRKRPRSVTGAGSQRSQCS